MGWFGRKPRRVGFGQPPPSGHTAADHREIEAPVAKPSGDTKASDLQQGIAELKRKAPRVGNMVERIARRVMEQQSKRAASIGKSPRTSLQWAIILFFVLMFVLPILSSFLLLLIAAMS